MKKIIFFFLSFFFTITANAQNFPFTNWIWAYPNCENPEFVKTWWNQGNGKLRFYQLTEGETLVGDVSKVQTNTKFGVGSYQFFADNNYNEIYIFYNNNTARLFERNSNGKSIVSNGLIVGSKDITNTVVACDPKSNAASYVLNTINEQKNQNNSPQVSAQNVAGSYKEACYNSQGNFKEITYSDGVTAIVKDDIMASPKYSTCSCDIYYQSEFKSRIEINPSFSDRGSNPFPNNLWSVYTKNKYPYGGCPSEADYQTLKQSINNDKLQRDKEANNSKPMTKKEIAEFKKTCSVIVSKFRTAKDVCSTTNDPKTCIIAKKQLIEAETVGYPAIIAVLGLCSQLNYPISVFDWD